MADHEYAFMVGGPCDGCGMELPVPVPYRYDVAVMDGDVARYAVYELATAYGYPSRDDRGRLRYEYTAVVGGTAPGGHDWAMVPAGTGLPACRACGRVRVAYWERRPCPGPVPAG